MNLKAANQKNFQKMALSETPPFYAKKFIFTIYSLPSKISLWSRNLGNFCYFFICRTHFSTVNKFLVSPLWTFFLFLFTNFLSTPYIENILNPFLLQYWGHIYVKSFPLNTFYCEAVWMEFPSQAVMIRFICYIQYCSSRAAEVARELSSSTSRVEWFPSFFIFENEHFAAD